MKLMVMGYGRHGKDTFCELSGMSFESSSMFAAERAVFPVLAPLYGYESLEQCYADRAHHRAEWYQLIEEYNTPDKTRLSREIFGGVEIYCGIRCEQEFLAVREAGLFDLAIWVDASERLPKEPSDSISVRPEHADIVISNNGTLAEFKVKVARLVLALKANAGVAA
ncbi:hypothetical protein ACJJIE_00205 (plasmid) [Microbulbifer sp. TRSA001]|uniref:hypothetical protein n=1 Tax=Microbulbifer sp. TRSA001 TaxID=3243381 RepID=UPI00403A792D